MKVKDLHEHFVIKLNKLYNKEEAERLFFVFLEEISGITRIEYHLLDPSATIRDNELKRYLQNLNLLFEGQPYQYVLGYTHFLDLKIKVSPSVLIPRPETEELAFLINQKLAGKVGLRALDIGTGSGCLALALAKGLSNAKVEAWDISQDALELARENARFNNLNVEFIYHNMLQEVATEGGWDVIASNPPYIADSEKREMESNVLDFEPHLALFVPDSDPLIFYRKIVEFAKGALNNGGHIFLEINQSLGQPTLALYKEAGFEAKLLKDMSGNDRFIIATK